MTQDETEPATPTASHESPAFLLEAISRAWHTVIRFKHRVTTVRISHDERRPPSGRYVVDRRPKQRVHRPPSDRLTPVR
jgi:hypothetical protein